jgi:hypothetical protein
MPTDLPFKRAVLPDSLIPALIPTLVSAKGLSEVCADVRPGIGIQVGWVLQLNPEPAFAFWHQGKRQPVGQLKVFNQPGDEMLDVLALIFRAEDGAIPVLDCFDWNSPPPPLL